MSPRTAMIGLLTLLYPLAVYAGLERFEPRWLALMLFALAFARASVNRERMWLAAALGSAVLVVAAFVANSALPLKLYPVLVNAGMLTVFATSLRFPPCVVERMARLSNPNLDQDGVAYARKVTWIWCGFFVFNGAVALTTALYANDATWALYNGLIAYVLMALLFAGEWLLRPRRPGAAP